MYNEVFIFSLSIISFQFLLFAYLTFVLRGGEVFNAYFTYLAVIICKLLLVNYILGIENLPAESHLYLFDHLVNLVALFTFIIFTEFLLEKQIVSSSGFLIIRKLFNFKGLILFVLIIAIDVLLLTVNQRAILFFIFIMVLGSNLSAILYKSKIPVVDHYIITLLGCEVLTMVCVITMGSFLISDSIALHRSLVHYLFYPGIVIETTLFSIGAFYGNYAEYAKLKKFKEQIEKSELTQLKANVKPSFISRAFESLKRYQIENPKDDPTHLIREISAFVGSLLKRSSVIYEPLEDELHHLEQYLKIEKAISQDQFLYDISIDEDVDTFGIIVPSLFLHQFIQEILDTRNSEISIRLKLKICMDGNNVVIYITKSIKNQKQNLGLIDINEQPRFCLLENFFDIYSVTTSIKKNELRHLENYRLSFVPTLNYYLKI